MSIVELGINVRVRPRSPVQAGQDGVLLANQYHHLLRFQRRQRDRSLSYPILSYRIFIFLSWVVIISVTLISRDRPSEMCFLLDL